MSIQSIFTSSDDMGNSLSKTPADKRKKSSILGSDYGDTPPTTASTSSSTSGIGGTSTDLKIMLGRGFNDSRVANRKYMLPSDDGEIDRLTIQHYCIRNFHPPIEKQLEDGICVLDVG
ncbi:hypothetical protein BC936DRAFT_147600 [Jimgerdemannia flammicorona]|uniref:Uncharacterized protein n=2 Tax=Jimgerdemannia flammicorona TaxID=994334 RepID=A0A433D4Y6_9FUNG|nr:hypothetical protein BC936DRAFT_147600 [Jimgerdemannia flammicorona]RUS29666.1 hypothetical protein BC938DRAFT_480391 [Jimgerdemannia flammicorona]